VTSPSWPREQFDKVVKTAGAHVVRFDEDTQNWSAFFKRLLPLLGRLWVCRVVLGGLWYYPDNSSGCVNALHKLLEQAQIPVSVDTDIVGIDPEQFGWPQDSWFRTPS